MTGNPIVIILMLVVIAFIGLVLLIVLTTTRGSGRRLLNQDLYRTAWLEIENNIIRDNSASYQFAILSADKLLDKALIETGVEGETMGERLKHSNKLFRNLNGVWTAHKLRNKIAHESGKRINRILARRMLNIYKNALKDLGAI